MSGTKNSDYAIKGEGSKNRWFLNSASVLLLTFALAFAMCNVVNSDLLLPKDPLSEVSLQAIFWILGGLFFVVSLVCLGLSSYLNRAVLVAWIAFNFQIYQSALFFHHNGAMHGYFGYYSSLFNLPLRMIELFVQGAFLYLLVGSLLVIVRLRRGERQAEVLAGRVACGEMLKCHCHGCGGHLLFSATNLGQKLPCPHCQTMVTLRKADESLKMACFFCKENIAFPAHAVGQKICCPHCNKDVRLKEEIA